MFLFVSFVAAIAGFLFGFDEGVISGASLYLRHEIPFDATGEGIMTSAVPLGALMAAVVTGRITSRFGRKRVLVLAGLLFLFGAGLSAATPNLEILILARLILGWAIGIAAIVAPLYLSETAPTRVRGIMIATYQLMVTLGIVAAYMINLALAHLEAWRLMFGAGAVPAILLFLGASVIPESPRWLASKGRYGEARAALSKLRKRESPDAVKEEMDRVIAVAGMDATSKGGSPVSWREVFSPETRIAVVIAMGLFFLQQLSGINAVIYYAPQIFAGTGFADTSGQLLATVGIGVTNVLMTLVGMWLIDKAGRRSLLVIGFSGTAIGLLMLTYSHSAVGDIAGLSGNTPAMIAFVGILIYISCFAIALGPIPYVIMSEIYPTRVRGPGMALASVANWGFNYLVVLSFPLALASVGLGTTFLFFASICVLGLVFSLWLVPETKGVSLEEIEQHLYSGRPIRQLGRAQA